MGKRMRKEEPLQPCSTKSGELNREGKITVADEEGRGGKELDSVHPCSQSKVDEEKIQDEEINVWGIPLSHTCENAGARVTFVLEKASLALAYVGKRYQILSSDEHADYLRKKNLNPYDYRPDVVHEALRAILDSPLNKAGMVGDVYVKTDSDVIFEVKPHTRMPRTLKRFCGIMVELLKKSCVRAKDSGEVLIRVLNEPLAQYMPENARIIGLSYRSEKLVDVEDYLFATRDDSDLVFVVGTMVHGTISKDLTNDYISVSSYPLSAKCCVGLVCEALEQKWKLAHG